MTKISLHLGNFNKILTRLGLILARFLDYLAYIDLGMKDAQVLARLAGNLRKAL